jgi:hypothetical protein
LLKPENGGESGPLVAEVVSLRGAKLSLGTLVNFCWFLCSLYSFQLLQLEVHNTLEAFANSRDLAHEKQPRLFTCYDLTRQAKLLLEDINHKDLALNIK